MFVKDGDLLLSLWDDPKGDFVNFLLCFGALILWKKPCDASSSSSFELEEFFSFDSSSSLA